MSQIGGPQIIRLYRRIIRFFRLRLIGYNKTRMNNLKKYGKVEIIRAKGVTRFTNLTGAVVFSAPIPRESDYHVRTVVLCKHDLDELGDDDKNRLLKMLKIEDDPKRVIWWSSSVSVVKDPGPLGGFWYYLDKELFSFREDGILVRRSIDLASNKPTVKYVVGEKGIIDREQIRQTESDENFRTLLFFVLLFGFFFVLFVIGIMAK